MRFRIEQVFEAPLPTVEHAFLDKAFLTRLAQLPKLGCPELVEQTAEGQRVHQVVRYRFSGALSPAVTRVVDPSKLTWLDDSTLDRTTHVTWHRVLPDHYANRLICTYSTTLRPELEHTRRTTDGDLQVRFPLVGGRVERAIVSGLHEHAELEAEVFRDWVRELG